jgi:hypothetical protein
VTVTEVISVLPVSNALAMTARQPVIRVHARSVSPGA